MLTSNTMTFQNCVPAVLIFTTTVGISLTRPRVGRIQLDHAGAAVMGAILTIVTGVLPPMAALQALKMLALPVLTIVSLMTITLIAERAGLLDLLARSIARLARGDGRRLFLYLFACGTATGTVFTNDAAVLIFTPLVYGLMEEIAEPSWTKSTRIPFYFAVLYVGNLVGALVVSNPINIIVSSIFGIHFADYAAWMVLPAIVSMVVSYFGLRLFFRKNLPDTYRIPDHDTNARRDPFMVRACAVILTLALFGFFSEELTGIPTWAVAMASAVVLMVLYKHRGGSEMDVIRGVGWDVIIFVIGIFVVAMGLRNVGLTHLLGKVVQTLGASTFNALTYSTGFVAAICSSLMNNHPTAGLMIWVIEDLGQTLSLSSLHTKLLVFSALVGGDLGPKMLPIGSLAALLWFRMLRDRGVHISYLDYIKIGIPVTLSAVFLSILMLTLELAIFK